LSCGLLLLVALTLVAAAVQLHCQPSIEVVNTAADLLVNA
jgi:hypothetical protein